MRAWVLAVCVLAAAAACTTRRPPRTGADLVVTHARVWTGDPLQPTADAVAVVGDRIVDVGSTDEIDHWRAPSTTVIEAAGRLVVPGFNDPHVHLVEGGAQLDSVDLRDADSSIELTRRIGERAKTKPGEWILGGGWDEQRWAPAELPTRRLIDERTNGTPVFVVRYDRRAALANSAAFGRAGITEHTPDPPGGVIVRDAQGMPTGVLRDAAMDLVARAVPKMTPERRTRAVRRAMQLAASVGVTSVHDMSPSYDDIAVYADLANRRELTVRIYAAPPDTGWYDQAKLGLHRGFGSPWLRLGAVHAAFDPALPSGEQRTRLMAADHAGLQLCLEASSARDATAALSLLGDLVRVEGDRDRRLRIEHAEHADASEVAHFVERKAIASIDANTPEEFARFAHVSGTRVAIGSDWPSAPLNPFARLSPAAAYGTVPVALSAFTSGPAFAEFQESDKGTIARGKLADLVILSDDLLAIAAPRIAEVRVLTTIAGGRVVHQRNP